MECVRSAVEGNAAMGTNRRRVSTQEGEHEKTEELTVFFKETR